MAGIIVNQLTGEFECEDFVHCVYDKVPSREITPRGAFNGVERDEFDVTVLDKRESWFCVCYSLNTSVPNIVDNVILCSDKLEDNIGIAGKYFFAKKE